jgi:hypothetical protein
MAEEFQQQSTPQDPTTALLSEFGTRLTEIEEKQRLIKDRLLLIGENLISTKEDIEKQNLEFKTKIKETDSEIKALKQITKRIVNELGNFARKPELEILQRQMKMFQPLEFARIQDINEVVKEEITKQLKTKKTK